MKEYIIRENEAGQRLDKYLGKLLREAPKSFFYKMLRKKNITLNGKKAQGGEKLKSGDTVRLFLGDETFEKLQGKETVGRAYQKLSILYEDQDVILINKPAGMLSQPAKKQDGPSLVEYLTGYLLASGSLTEEELLTFRPSVCNRLDRNTSGIVAAGKTLAGLQMLSELFHDRTMHKFYLCLVKGQVKTEKYIKGYLHKDNACNKVEITQEEREGAVPIETEYVPLGSNQEMTLLLVRLITGRTHQIRAHLAYEGHPVLGDSKYGDSGFNRRYGERCRLNSQLLHAYRMEFPTLEGRFSGLSGKKVTAPVPAKFLSVLKEQHLEGSYYESME